MNGHRWILGQSAAFSVWVTFLSVRLDVRSSMCTRQSSHAHEKGGNNIPTALGPGALGNRNLNIKKWTSGLFSFLKSCCEKNA